VFWFINPHANIFCLFIKVLKFPSIVESRCLSSLGYALLRFLTRQLMACLPIVSLSFLKRFQFIKILKLLLRKVILIFAFKNRGFLYLSNSWSAHFLFWVSLNYLNFKLLDFMILIWLWGFTFNYLLNHFIKLLNFLTRSHWLIWRWVDTVND
jgi:hypothetical protein